jgi:hypothetical protein
MLDRVVNGMNSLQPSKTPPKKLLHIVGCRIGLTANVGIGVPQSGLEDREWPRGRAAYGEGYVPETEHGVSSDVEVRVGR